MAKYKAVARLKVDDNDYIERGEDVTSKDVEDLDALIASGSVMEASEFNARFPEVVTADDDEDDDEEPDDDEDDDQTQTQA